MEDLTVLSHLVELAASSWILAASLWRSWFPPHCLLVENYCLLVENFAFRPVSDVTIGLLAFFFFPEDLLGRFRRLPRDVFVVFWIVPLGPISILWLRRYGRNFLPTLRSDFVIHETLL